MANAFNLIQGPADLWIGSFGAVTEPATSADFASVPTSGWTALGLTQGGVTLGLTKEYAALEADQLTLTPHSVVTSESVTLTTSMAEGTLENLVLAMNDGTVTTGGGVKSYEPLDSLAGRPTNYKAIMLKGPGPANPATGAALGRFVVIRKVLSTEGVSLAYSKTDQTVLEVTFTGHWVSSAIRPYKILDQS